MIVQRCGRALLLVVLLHCSVGRAEDLYVEVQTVKLRAAPKAWALPLSEVNYGDKVVVLQRERPWVKVKTAANVEGFLHETAVTSRRPLTSTKDVAVNRVNAADVVLAGKGFNDQILAEWEKSNPEAKMSLVDAMEKRSKVPLPDIIKFIQVGGLNLEGRQ